MADVNMRILLSAVGGAGVTSVIGDLAKSLGSGGLGGALLGVTAVAVGTAVAIGTTAVKAAGDFQAQTERLVTSAGELQSNLGLVRSGILQMSVDTATSTEQLSAGMYYVESSGFHAADGLNVLRVAAMGAKSENADLDTVSKALTTTMIDYHMKSGQAADAMNGLIATVQNGKTSLQDLSASMGAVLPIASALGISFPQVAGAMDTMTNAGLSAHQASQNLAHVLVALQSPSGVAVKSMQSVGLSAQQVKDTLVNQGLPAALQLIEDHVGKKFPAGSVENVTALKNIMGGLVGLKLAAQLTGGSLQETKDNINKVSEAMKNGHGSVMGWSEVQSTFNFKMDQAKQGLNSVMITIGTALLPVMSNLLGAVTPILTSFAKWLTSGNHLQNAISAVGNVLGVLGKAISTVVSIGVGIFNFFKNNQVAADALGAVLLTVAGIVLAFAIASIPPLVVAFGAWAVGAGAAAIATLAATWPIILIGVLIAALIFGIIMLIQHWKQVAAFAVMIWGHIAQFFQDDVVKPIGSLFNQLGTNIHNIINGIGGFFSGLGSTVQTVISSIGGFFTGLWNNIQTGIGNVIKWFQNLPGAAVKEIQSLASQGLKLFQGFWNSIVSDAKSILSNIGSAIGNAFKQGIDFLIINPVNNLINGINSITGKIGIPAIPHIPQLAAGGTIAMGGLAIVGEQGPELVALPGGATVYPHGSGPASAGGGVTNNFYISLNTMARSQSEVRNLVDMVEQEIARRFRNQTSGYASGGVW